MVAYLAIATSAVGKHQRATRPCWCGGEEAAQAPTFIRLLLFLLLRLLNLRLQLSPACVPVHLKVTVSITIIHTKHIAVQRIAILIHWRFAPAARLIAE